MKKFAFTLAETLVVMGIIGVVAALTIPNLNQSTGDREKVAKVKKIYSNLEDAFGRATAVYGPFDEWFINDVGENGSPDNKAISTRIANRITEFMKVSKDCGYEGTGCFSDSYKRLDDDKMPSPIENKSSYMVLLADGTALNFDSSSVFVDIDGIKGANTLGKDLFSFVLNKDGIVPPVTIKDGNEALKLHCFNLGVCSGWVVMIGNMDYLKINNKGICPNGTELTWENTSCK